MNAREYVADAVSTWRASRSEESRREVIRRMWDIADQCWAIGDRAAAERWEELALGDDWQAIA